LSAKSEETQNKEEREIGGLVGEQRKRGMAETGKREEKVITGRRGTRRVSGNGRRTEKEIKRRRRRKDARKTGRVMSGGRRSQLGERRMG